MTVPHRKAAMTCDGGSSVLRTSRPTCTAALLAATLALTACAVDGKITHLEAPIMGFSTWNYFACNIDEVC